MPAGRHMIAPSPRRRLLVITYHFPPDGAVGGQRWAGLSKYLARLGWDVHVVTSGPPDGTPLPANVYRYHRVRRATLNDAYNAVARRVRSAVSNRANTAPEPTTAAAGGRSASLPARVISNGRLVAQLALGFPDVARGWVLRAAGVARGLLRQHDFDAVVTSGPPHSAHFAGWLATLGRREAFVVDMRDPWLQTHKKWGAYGAVAGSVQSLIAALQRTVFRRASAIVVNTHEFVEHLHELDAALPVSHVSNGVDLEGLPLRTAARFDTISIAYVGTLYVGRNFSTVLGALASLARDRSDQAARVTLRIAGHMDPPHEERLRGQLAADGLTENVHIYGRLPRQEALDLLARSELALVLAQEQPTQVPAKIYECVGLGVPTLVVAERDSAAAREARRIGAMTLDTDDVAGMRAILDDLVDGRVPACISAKVPISYEALAVQMDGILTSATTRSRAERQQ